MDNEIFTASIRGSAPLICHNGALADPENHFARELKKSASGKAKDLVRAAKIEFLGSLYLDDSGEPCIPVELILASLLAGARAHKLGKQFAAGVYDVTGQSTFRLEYRGPRDPDQLYELDDFRDRRGVRVQTSRIIRTRPIFRGWSCSFNLEFDPTLVSRSEIETALQRAGKAVGIGDYRPRFGRFVIEAMS